MKVRVKFNNGKNVIVENKYMWPERAAKMACDELNGDWEKTGYVGRVYTFADVVNFEEDE
jgi:hypothetical protein